MRTGVVSVAKLQLLQQALLVSLDLSPPALRLAELVLRQRLVSVATVRWKSGSEVVDDIFAFRDDFLRLMRPCPTASRRW